MSKQTMVPDYGVASDARNQTVYFFVPSVSFLVKSPYVIFSISTFILGSMAHHLFSLTCLLLLKDLSFIFISYYCTWCRVAAVKSLPVHHL